MTTFIVMFEREKDDEIVPEADRQNPVAHFGQMVAEFHDAEPFSMKMLGFMNNGPYFTFTALVEHDGDCKSLSERLQTAYNDAGVAGFYEIVGTTTDAAPIDHDAELPYQWGMATDAETPHAWVERNGVNLFRYPLNQAVLAEQKAAALNKLAASL